MNENKSTRERPFGLYIIIILQVLIALSLAAGLILLQVTGVDLPLLLRDQFLFKIYGWIIAGVFLLASLGLLRLKRWGWVLSMLLIGTNLVYNIWLYFQGDAHYLDMVANIVIVFYLNQRDVQAPFMTQNQTSGGSLE